MQRLPALVLLLAVCVLPGGTAPAVGSSDVPSPAVGSWPTGRPGPVVRGFDPPERPWLAGHRGVDLLTSPGAVVHAPIAGAVVFAGDVADRPVLVVASGAARVSLEPVIADVAVGARVAAGDPIGRSADAAGHCPPASCLHWGLRIDGVYHDPLLLVLRQRAVLLP